MVTKMKNNLIETIRKIISLLDECSYFNQADWFKERLVILQSSELNSELFMSSLREIQDIIAGSGSFSDLSMIPNKISKLSREEANQRKWDLIDLLEDEIGRLLI
jgi:hypothetical protein